MFKKLKRLFLIVVIFFQKLSDNIYRLFKGIPRLKRSQLTATLFLGSQYSAVGLDKLRALGITAIVNMRMHSVFEDARYQGIKYLHLPIQDNTAPPLEVLQKGIDFIQAEIKNGGKVYIHCRQGLGRGPTMAIAYLISTGLTYEDAFALVKKVRTFINPKPVQVERLKELEALYSSSGKKKETVV